MMKSRKEVRKGIVLEEKLSYRLKEKEFEKYIKGMNWQKKIQTAF
jgi:hypothetical protein